MAKYTQKPRLVSEGIRRMSAPVSLAEDLVHSQILGNPDAKRFSIVSSATLPRRDKQTHKNDMTCFPLRRLLSNGKKKTSSTVLYEANAIKSGNSNLSVGSDNSSESTVYYTPRSSFAGINSKPKRSSLSLADSNFNVS